MYKKISILCSFLSIAALVGCNKKVDNETGGSQTPDVHEHTYNTAYVHDETNHWHSSSCGHEGFTSGFEAHKYGDDNVCDVCGYEKPAADHVHTYSSSWSKDETNHWYMSNCEHTGLAKDLESHDFGGDNVCDVCGYEKSSPEHVHTFATSYSHDSINHWHASTCGHNDLVSGFGQHVDIDKNGKCDDCGYTIPTESEEMVVLWKNYDGSIISFDTFKEGTTPEYAGDLPTKMDETYAYKFTGWEFETEVENTYVSYVAQFEVDTTTYTIKWVNYDDTLLEEDTVQVGFTPTYDGEIPTKPSDGNDDYVFAGWDPEVTRVVGNTTYKAVFNVDTKDRYKATVEEIRKALDIYSFDNLRASGQILMAPAEFKKANGITYEVTETYTGSKFYTYTNDSYVYSSTNGKWSYTENFSEAPYGDEKIFNTFYNFNLALLEFERNSNTYVYKTESNFYRIKIYDKRIVQLKAGILENTFEVEFLSLDFEYGTVQPFSIPEEVIVSSEHVVNENGLRALFNLSKNVNKSFKVVSAPGTETIVTTYNGLIDVTNGKDHIYLDDEYLYQVKEGNTPTKSPINNDPYEFVIRLGFYYFTNLNSIQYNPISKIFTIVADTTYNVSLQTEHGALKKAVIKNGDDFVRSIELIGYDVEVEIPDLDYQE